MMRLQFDLVDVIRTARGIPRENGFAVFPDDVADKIEEELERLYAIEDAALQLADEAQGLALGDLRKVLHG